MKKLNSPFEVAANCDTSEHCDWTDFCTYSSTPEDTEECPVRKEFTRYNALIAALGLETDTELGRLSDEHVARSKQYKPFKK